MDVTGKLCLPNGVAADEALMPINVIVTDYDDETH